MNEIELREVVCTKILYQNDKGFQIAIFKDKKSNSNYTIKGTLFAKTGMKYNITASLDDKNTKYDATYWVDSIRLDFDLNNASEKDLQKFLSSIISYDKAKKLSKVKNLIDVLEEMDIDKLMEVKGVGRSTAENVITAYFNQKDISDAYIYFADYGFTKKTIKKICKYYKSSSVAIETIKNDPYELTKVPGMGFKKVDGAFLLYCNNNGLNINDTRRTKAYVRYLFDEEYQSGNTWLDPLQILEKVKEYLPNVDLKYVIDYINDDNNFYSINNQNQLFNQTGKRITSKNNVLREMEIAQRIRRLATSQSSMKLKNVDQIIKDTEANQGWEYSQEQREAIDMLINQNICLLQGLGGTGKSSTLNAYINIIRKNGYSFKQCALSGKAANNMFLITRQKGSTIHSLLQLGTKKPLDDSNPILSDVIILDEVSMVDQKLFLSLIKAIKKGSKLIMIGDSGQLDSIGASVMNGIIKSNAIPTTTLTEIHRQAQNSAIITHSAAFRNGEKPEELTATKNTSKTYGNAQDLKYIFVDHKDEDDIYKHVIDEFKKGIQKFGVDGVQIICSTKSTGKNSTQKLNTFAQILANDYSPNKQEIDITKNDYTYTLRENDKVMNVRNNRNTTSPEGFERPIFNGNTGTLIEFIRQEEEVIEEKIIEDEVIKEKIIEEKIFALIDFDGIGEVLVEEQDFKNIELGYASTIHKSQGSTIPCVILALPYHYMLNSRELLYTAATRAKDYQVIITSPRTLKHTLDKTSKREEKTNIDLFIRELDKWKEELDIK